MEIWEYKCRVAGGLSGILTYGRIREAPRSWVEPPNLNTEYLMPCLKLRSRIDFLLPSNAKKAKLTAR